MPEFFCQVVPQELRTSGRSGVTTVDGVRYRKRSGKAAGKAAVADDNRSAPADPGKAVTKHPGAFP